MAQDDSDVISVLKVIIEADKARLTQGLTAAVQESRQAGQQMGQGLRSGLTASVGGLGSVGTQAGQQLGEGLTHGADGKLREARGKFVKAGQEAGQGFADGIKQGTPAVGSAITGLTSALSGGGSGGIGAAFGRITAGAGGLSAGLTGIIGVAGPAGAAIAGVGAAAAAVIAPVNAAINIFSEFEYGLAKVSTLTDKTPQQLRGTGQEILRLSAELGASFQSLNEGLYDILGAGVKGTESMEAALAFLEQAAKLAKAGATDTAVATDVLTSVMNAYKMTASDAGAVSDKLFKAVDLGKMSFEQLAQSLGMVTAISSQAGVSLDEVLAALSTMTANGVQASSAVDYLRSLISSISKPSQEAAKMADQLGIAFNEQALKGKGLTGVLQEVMEKTGGSTQKLGTLFGGVEAVTAATSIASGEFKRMGENIAAIGSSAGATEVAYGKMASTVQQENDKLAANWQRLMAGMGEVFAPFKLDVLSGLNDLLNHANEVLAKWMQVRQLRSATTNLSELEQQLENTRQGKAIAERTLNDPNASAASRIRAKRDLEAANASIALLNERITAARAESARLRAEVVATGTSGLAPNVQGPRYGGEYKGSVNIPAESGKFGYAFISSLANVFKSDPRVASDCAVIAYAILDKLGVKVKGTQLQNANAGVLEKNAIASGFTRVEGDEIRPGDLIVWTSGNGKKYGAVSGKHVGVAAGVNAKGQLMVINNPGDRPTVVEPMYDRQNATVYRAPNSPFATGKPTVPRSSSAPAPTDTESPITAAQIVKAQQLLDAVEKAKKAMQAAPGNNGLKIAYDAATQALNRWTGASKENARAAQAVQESQTGAAGAYLATTADLKKYGADALRLQKDLDNARASGNAQAIVTAERNMAAWLGESRAKKAVLDAETAAYRARQQQAAEAQRQTERDSAPARTQAEIRAQEKLEKALRSTSRARLEQLAAGTVGENGLTLEKWKAARAEIERRDRAEAESRKRNKEVAQQLAGMNQAQRQAQVQAAQDELTRLQNDRQARLNAVKGNAAATLQVEKETAGAIQAQEEKLALTRLVAAKRQAEEEKKARIAAIPQGATAAQRQALEASAQAEYLGKISSAYRTYALTVSKSQQDAAQAVQAATEQQGDKLRSLRDEYSRLAQGMRDKIAAGKVEQADLTAYLRGLDELEGKAKKAGLTNDQHVRGARASAEALYQQGIDAQIAAGAFGDLADSHDRAAKASAGYTVTLEDALAQLPTGTSATETYVRALEDLAAQGKVSKDVLDAVKQTIADRTVKWQLEADAIARVTKEGLDNAQALSDLGDTEGAINSLYTVLNDLYTRLENGEDVADAINQVTDAINGLGAALELDTEFNTFIAGLSGTLSDQIDQVVSRLDEVTDNPQLAARLKAYLADLRKQFAQAYSTDPYSAGYINNGSVPSKTSGPDYQTIARARDLGTALAEETDPAKLQGLMAEITEFLASDIAQSLPEATRKGLEDGVRDAQGYIDILGGITEDTIIDGWERATRNVKPPPTNEFTDWADKIFGLGRAGLADPTQKNALVESLQQARAESRLTEADLQNLLALIDEFTRELEPDTIGKAFDFGQWQRGVQELTDWFDSGTITAEQYTEGLHNAASELYEMAAAAEAAGNIPLAQRFREQAVALRALNPEIARTLRTLGKVQEYAGYVQDLAGAFGQLADAAGNGDLAANLNGIGNLAGKAAALAGDVMRIIANPADIGAWVGAITKVVGGIAEALGGFKKAHAEAKRLKDEFQDQNPLLNAGDYQKTFVRSRGFFADLFGGGPEVVNEVDKLGYLFAKTMQSSFVDGITNGLKEAILKNDFSLFSGKLRETVYGGLLDGVIDLFLNDTLLKEIIAPAIKAWSDALKTPDTADDAAALAGIDAAIDQVDQRASRFYSDVAPKLQGIGEKWGIDQGGAAGNSSRDLIGAPPAAQLGIPRIEVSFPADALRPLTDFGNAVPVFARASDTLLRAAELLLQRGGSGGPPPLSGSGSLV